MSNSLSLTTAPSFLFYRELFARYTKYISKCENVNEFLENLTNLAGQLQSFLDRLLFLTNVDTVAIAPVTLALPLIKRLVLLNSSLMDQEQKLPADTIELIKSTTAVVADNIEEWFRRAMVKKDVSKDQPDKDSLRNEQDASNNLT